MSPESSPLAIAALLEWHRAAGIVVVVASMLNPINHHCQEMAKIRGVQWLGLAAGELVVGEVPASQRPLHHGQHWRSPGPPYQ